jgi:hypothetical protein
MITYILDSYILTYDEKIKTETFECEQYYGITFHMKDKRYQVLHNYDLGNRIIINPNNGGFQDIPFKPDTFWFLPPGVEARETHE